MDSREGLSRRAVLAGAAAGAVTVGLPAAAAAGSAPQRSAGGEGRVDEEFTELERTYRRRLGVVAINVRTGATLEHRPDERFPICSVFKVLLAARILRDFPSSVRDRRLTWTADDLVINSPVTEVTIRNGLTVSQLVEAAVTVSDNTATNLLMREFGGPAGVTGFARSVGDPVTRIDRWEPEMSTGAPGDERDTTSPRAIARTFGTLVLGSALPRADRRLLTTWMLANRTAGPVFGSGVPAGWKLADKTGSGWYGVRNDVGITWTPDGVPLVVAAFTRGTHYEDDTLSEPIAAVAESACRRLTGGDV
ncbi:MULTISPECIES: class A beta-lactamase [Prauserella salsuginis group]|uniref:Beta-lactamase n=1 Tax=Prauserella salsuginis TaxID=387889 RepID=A0ABW6GBG6_9PSEU|nr:MULTISPECIES: class A beta-lactamase [Prauserella salsuginis group]MCR3722869.1 beta-lactamase class A [Prauserella flava]MCR3737456.1 beta-lactamase class A [Prauserella salsuginis]